MIQEVVVATASDEIREVVQAWGGRTVQVPPGCKSGTDCLATSAGSLEGEFIVCVQGDEPLVDPLLIDAVAMEWQTSRSPLVTAIFEITTDVDLDNPNIVKVARSSGNEATYFSRSTIPYVQGIPRQAWRTHQRFWGHVGLYGYRRDMLIQYPSLPISPLARAEQLEQLRYVEAGFRFRVVESRQPRGAVDTLEDLERVRRILESNT